MPIGMLGSLAALATGGRSGSKVDPLKRRAKVATERDLSRGNQAEDEYYNRATSFDAQESMNTAAEGAYGVIKPQIRDELARRRAGSVGRGRLDTGFQDIDEREVIRRGDEHLRNTVASNALQGTALQLQNDQGIGAYGERTSTRGMDMLSAERDREAAEEEAERQRKASRWGALAGLAGGVAGTVFGPAGAALGNRVGKWAAGKVGG